MKLLAALLCLMALPAAATQDAWPALFDVVDVAADDVLNIRQAPDATAPIVSSLAPGTKGIEVVRPDDRLVWGQVNWAEGVGWVSLRYLRRHPAQWLGALPQVARCAGTEPFWSLQVAGDELTYTSLDRDAQAYALHQSGPAQGRRDRFHLIAKGNSGTAIAALAAQACNDGMSDRAYGLTVDLLLQGAAGWDHVSGCCSLQR